MKIPTAMIIPKCVHPSHSLYYVGGMILRHLLDNKGRMKTADLYVAVQEAHGISFPLMVLALDYLYLIGAIERKRNIVRICSSKASQ